jgi:hypothetical protein
MQEGSFRDFCILLGTDASPRIPKVGPVAAAKYMRMYKNVEKMLSLEPVMRDRLNDMYRPEESAQIGIDGGEEIEGENAPLDGVAQFLAAIDNSRRLFAELPPTPTYAPQRDYEDRTVRDWLQSEHGIKVWVRVPAARFREKHASKEIEAELELAPDAVTVATLVAEMAKVAEREAPAAVLSASVCAEPYSATRGRSGRKDVSWDDIPIDEVLPGPRMQNAPVLAPFDEGR